MSMQVRESVFALVVVAILTVPAAALTVDSSGNITDWGVTPFGSTPASWAPAPSPYVTYWVEQNNTSPVNYPWNIGYVPSPGGATGEAFDMEAFYSRVVQNRLQVLLISSAPNFDLFLDVPGGQQTGYDFAVGSLDWNAGDASLYRINGSGDVLDIITGSGGYGGYPNIAAQVNPWRVVENANRLVGTAGEVSIEQQTFNYGQRMGANENGTWLYEWDIPMSLLGGGTGPLGLHITVECGNDVINNVAVMSGPPVPEPLTIVGAMMGLGGIGGYIRRRLA